MTLEPSTVHILNVVITVMTLATATFVCLVMAAHVVKLFLRALVHVIPSRSQEKIELSEEDQLAQTLVSDLEPIRTGKFGDHPMDPVRRENLRKIMAAREERLRTRVTTERKTNEDE